MTDDLPPLASPKLPPKIFPFQQNSFGTLATVNEYSNSSNFLPQPNSLASNNANLLFENSHSSGLPQVNNFGQKPFTNTLQLNHYQVPTQNSNISQGSNVFSQGNNSLLPKEYLQITPPHPRWGVII